MPEHIQKSLDKDQAIEFVLASCRSQTSFVHGIWQIDAKPEEESFDVLQFKDRRIIERYSLPQRSAGNGGKGVEFS